MCLEIVRLDLLKNKVESVPTQCTNVMYTSAESYTVSFLFVANISKLVKGAI